MDNSELDGVFDIDETIPVLEKYEDITINIWLYSGVHHFIVCDDRLARKLEVFSLTEYDPGEILAGFMCIEEYSYQYLKKVYPTYDNVKFYIRPIECKD